MSIWRSNGLASLNYTWLISAFQGLKWNVVYVRVRPGRVGTFWYAIRSLNNHTPVLGSILLFECPTWATTRKSNANVLRYPACFICISRGAPFITCMSIHGCTEGVIIFEFFYNRPPTHTGGGAVVNGRTLFIAASKCGREPRRTSG